MLYMRIVHYTDNAIEKIAFTVIIAVRFACLLAESGGLQSTFGFDSRMLFLWY